MSETPTNTHCVECDYTFSKVSNFRQHVRRKHPDKVDALAPPVLPKYDTDSVTCTHCDKLFSKQSNLTRHMKEKHPEKIEVGTPINEKNSECSECKMSFSHRSSLSRHIKREHPEKRILQLLSKLEKCSECEKSFSKKSNLNCHMKLHHPESVGEVKVGGKENKNEVTCSRCGKSFSKRSNLLRHMREKHFSEQLDNSAPTCIECEKTFSRKTDLATHINNKHFDKLEIMLKSDFFAPKKFQKIGTAFTKRIRAQKVFKIVAKCNECGQCFTRRTALRTHVKKNHPSKLQDLTPLKFYKRSATCGECNKSYSKRYDLIKHVRGSHPEKLQNYLVPKKRREIVTCCECNNIYTRRYELIKHAKLRHPDKLEHVLKASSKRVDQCKSTCTECSTSFTSTYDSKVHMKNKHPDKYQEIRKANSKKVYKSAAICTECNTTFTRTYDLRVHMENKHPEKIDDLFPLHDQQDKVPKCMPTCAECNKSFKRLAHLRVHVKNKHPEKLADMFKLYPRKVRKIVASCSECHKSFTRKHHLRVHVKNKHPEKLKILFETLFLGPKREYKPVALCPDCNKTFTRRSHLRIHVNNKHPEKSHLYKLEKKTYHCQRCDADFEGFRTFTEHRKTHKLGNIKVLKCSLCEYSVGRKEILKNHFTESHDIELENENLEFPLFEDFENWKLKLEQDTYSSYIKLHGSYKTKNYTRISYSCHRSGDFKSKGKGLRRLKTQGSNKINGFCPASIDVTIRENCCQVQFLKTHVGHENDLRHTFLTASQRQELANRIAAKVPLPIILDEIRDSVTNSEIGRLHLLKKKDLYNIAQGFKLNKVCLKRPNNAASFESWVAQMEATGSVLFYKPIHTINEQYALKEEDVVLIIMTKEQCEILEKYGADCICLDKTGVNTCGFELNTILVLDDLKEGYPCSFLLTNCRNERILQIFFEAIKNRIGGKIKSKIFMADTSDLSYGVWEQVMEVPNNKLYNTWHVDQDWRENLERIQIEEKRVEVYKMLRTLLQEKDITEFTQMLHEFLTHWKQDSDISEFLNYLHQFYVCSVKEWAYCHRLYSDLDINMHIERMHRTIKYLFLNSKFAKRPDKAINSIMKFVRDKLFENVTNTGKSDSKVKDLINRHKSSEQLDFTCVVESETGWQVRGLNDEIYLVEEINKDCSCRLTCDQCEACLHRYSCSCLDSCIRWNMCEHIHLVCGYRRAQQVVITSEEQVVTGVQIEDEGDDNNYFIDFDPVDNEPSVIVETVSQPLESKNESELDERKAQLVAQFCQEITEISSVEELEAIEKIASTIRPTIEGLRTQRNNEYKTIKILKIQPAGSLNNFNIIF